MCVCVCVCVCVLPQIQENEASRICVELLGTTYEKLNQALTRKRIVTPQELIVKVTYTHTHTHTHPRKHSKAHTH